MVTLEEAKLQKKQNLDSIKRKRKAWMLKKFQNLDNLDSYISQSEFLAKCNMFLDRKFEITSEEKTWFCHYLHLAQKNHWAYTRRMVVQMHLQSFLDGDTQLLSSDIVSYPPIYHDFIQNGYCMHENLNQDPNLPKRIALTIIQETLLRKYQIEPQAKTYLEKLDTSLMLKDSQKLKVFNSTVNYVMQKIRTDNGHYQAVSLPQLPALQVREGIHQSCSKILFNELESEKKALNCMRSYRNSLEKEMQSKCPSIYSKIFPIDANTESVLLKLYNDFIDSSHSTCLHHLTQCLTHTIACITTEYRNIQNMKHMDQELRKMMPHYISSESLKTHGAIKRYKACTVAGMWNNTKLNSNRIYKEELLGQALVSFGLEINSVKYLSQAAAIYECFIFKSPDVAFNTFSQQSSSKTMQLQEWDWNQDVPESLWYAIAQIGAYEKTRAIRMAQVAALMREYDVVIESIENMDRSWIFTEWGELTIKKEVYTYNKIASWVYSDSTSKDLHLILKEHQKKRIYSKRYEYLVYDLRNNYQYQSMFCSFVDCDNFHRSNKLKVAISASKACQDYLQSTASALDAVKQLIEIVQMTLNGDITNEVMQIYYRFMLCPEIEFYL
jgi:hypothetical protein